MARVGARSGLEMLTRGDGKRGAEQAAELLGNLRGLAAKVGQTASYVDGLVPPGQAAAYEKALAKLQQATPKSPFSAVQAQIETELSASLATLFSEFDEAPVASASVGQVHRARLHDGREVAVKVQHPGIERAVESDLKSVKSVHAFASLFIPPGVNADALFEEVVSVLRGELDYRIEAKNQIGFAERYRDEPLINIPAIIETHCSQRVLTAEFVRGLSFDEAAQQPDVMRRHYAELLWYVVFSSVLLFGVFNADPHPGNYIFHEDGSITFLDFGCVRDVFPGFKAQLPTMHRAAMAQDRAAFHRACSAGLETRPGVYEDQLLGYLYECCAPVQTSPYRMEKKYAGSLVLGIRDLQRAILKKGSHVTPLPTGVVFLNRLQFGFYSVLARLNTDADYAGVNERILARVFE